MCLHGVDRKLLFYTFTLVKHAWSLPPLCLDVVFLGMGTAAARCHVVPGLSVVGSLIMYDLFNDDVSSSVFSMQW